MIQVLHPFRRCLPNSRFRKSISFTMRDKMDGIFKEQKTCRRFTNRDHGTSNIFAAERDQIGRASALYDCFILTVGCEVLELIRPDHDWKLLN